MELRMEDASKLLHPLACDVGWRPPRGISADANATALDLPPAN